MSTLSPEKHEQILRNTVVPDYTAGITRSSEPKAIILAGQPGAGKSGLAEQSIDTPSFKANHVRVDIDELRDAHPQYQHLQQTQPKIAADTVQKDASLWGKELREHCIENKFNIVVDGTLGDPEKADELVNNLKKEGYEIEVHVMAIDKDRSDQGIYARYEHGLKTNEARWVDPDSIAQDAYSGMVRSIETIEKNHPDVTMKLYGAETNDKRQRITKTLNKPDGVRARQAIEAERKRDWTDAEKSNYIDRSLQTINKMHERKAAKDELAQASLALKGERYQNCVKDLNHSKQKEKTPESLEDKIKAEHKGARVYKARSGTYSGRITHITENEVVQQVRNHDFYVHGLKKGEHDLKVNNEVTITNRQGKTLIKNQFIKKTQDIKHGMTNTSKSPSDKTRGL